MSDWTAADLAGMELCVHGERLKFCPVCGLMRNVAISLRPAVSKLATGLLVPTKASLPPALGRLPQPKRGPNKWEAVWGQELEIKKRLGEILWYQFEALRFRLADGAWYKPDYISMARDGTITAWEIKGFWRESARVRIKVAADRHPFRFIAVTKQRVKDGGGWSEEMFSAALDRIGLARVGRKA